VARHEKVPKWYAKHAKDQEGQHRGPAEPDPAGNIQWDCRRFGHVWPDEWRGSMKQCESCLQVKFR
jgi:hypothetical protein